MNIIQNTLQVVWASILLLGWLKLVIIVAVIAVLYRLQPLLGTLGVILFLAYLLHWI
jgi:hypothetical protein